MRYIYVVYYVEYDGIEIEGAFDSKEKAIYFIEKIMGEQYEENSNEGWTIERIKYQKGR